MKKTLASLLLLCSTAFAGDSFPTTHAQPEIVIGTGTVEPMASIYNKGSDGALVFVQHDGLDALRIEANGDFYVKGRKVTNDKELYRIVKKFFKQECK